MLRAAERVWKEVRKDLCQTQVPASVLQKNLTLKELSFEEAKQTSVELPRKSSF